MALYEPGARFVPRSGETVVGRDRIRHVMAELIRTKTRLHSRVIKEVTVDDIALPCTDFQGTMVDSSGETVEVRNKAIEVLRRQPDGTWKLIVGYPNGRAGEGERPVRTMIDVRHISVSINRAPDEVYRFASDAENLPQWATGLGGSIRKVDGEWIADGPVGRVKVRFAERNAFGVLDHDVVLESGAAVHTLLRVVPNGTGSEVIVTLFRQPGVSEQRFAEDAAWVEKDLGILKSLSRDDRILP
jgi:ketosteroid isomerase-like protein